MECPIEDLPEQSSSATTSSTPTSPVEAKQMFVLMKRDFRISRNVRAQWYFQHLNKTVKLKEEKVGEDNGADAGDEDLEVLGALPELSHPTDSYRLTPNSLVYFLGNRYRLVFILDYSPSTAVVDAEQNCVLHDKVFLAFRNFLMGLVQPFRIPGRNEQMSPQLYVTVLAYTPFLKNRGRQALLQGCLVNVSNLYASIRHVEVALQRFLRGVTEASALSAQAWDAHAYNRGRALYVVPSDSSLIDMIRFGMLAVQLLPENTSAGIIVFTDGVLGLPDSSILEALLSQLRVWTISCSFALVRQGDSPDYAFGKVPNIELMRFLASATFGVHLDECPNIGPSMDHRLNLYHKAVLCWSFQRALEDYIHCANHPLPFNQLPCQLVRVRNFSNTLATVLQSVLSVRLREGYTVKRVVIKEKQIKVELMLPWKYEVNLGYVVYSDWPPPKHGPKVKVELHAEGPYEFINDLMAPKAHQNISPYRALACRAYFDTIQNVIQADKMLVHFNSFCASPVYYTLPEPVKNGAPLFYMVADSDAPVVSSVELQQQQYAPFCQYWRPICLLDMNVWQKWLHTHRISLLLTHDAPLSAHLHTPSRTNGQYSSVSCRLAVTAIDNSLKQWATFTLMDNHSYIKFEYDESDPRVPSFFYIIRPSFKPPCIVIRLAFLGGICGAVRHQIVGELTERLLSLQISQRSLSSSAPISVDRSPSKASQLVSDQFVPVKACHQLKKPIEKILVRYDRIPKDLFHMVSFDDLGRASTSLNSVLCRYLHCKRYLWSLKGSASVLPLSAESASFILQTLVNRRLNDSFRFAYSCEGFLTLFKEYEVEECPFTSCSVQYVLFPPFLSNFLTGGSGSMTRDSVRSDNEHSEMESTEADTDALLVTELWIEPQFGFLRTRDDEQQSPTRLDLFEQFYQVDRDIIRCLVTFEHIKIVCKTHTTGGRSRRVCWRSSDRLQRSRSGSLDTDEITSPSSPRSVWLVEADQSVVVVPSCFHLSTIFTHSQLLTVFFSSLKRNDKKGTQQDDANVAFFESLNRQLKHVYDVYWPIESYDELHDVWTLICERLSNSTYNGNSCLKWMTNLENRLKPSTGATVQPPHRLPKLACYARLLADCRLTFLLCPATFDDALLLWTTTHHGTSAHSEGERISSEPDGSYSFPLFVFNCCQAMLSSVLSGEFELSHSWGGDGRSLADVLADVQLEDFRTGQRNESVLSAFHRELSRRLSEMDNNDQIIRKVHEKASSLCESINIGAYCSLLESIYSIALVDGVYRALRSEYPVHAADVVSVVDAKCEESVVGVELTPFLRSACQHWESTDHYAQKGEKGSVAWRSTRDSTFTLQTYSMDGGQPPDAFLTVPCETAFHRSVQSAFREVIRRSFVAISSCSDYYFYSPPVELDEPVSDGDSFSVASQEDDDQQAVVAFCIDETATNGNYRAPRMPKMSGGAMSTRTTTSFSSADGGQGSSCDSLMELVSESWRTPVFLHLACSVRLPGVMYSCSIQDLPVCLVILFRSCGFSSWEDDELWSQLDIRLDLMALTPQPVEDDVFTGEESDWWVENEGLDIGRRSSHSIDQEDAGVSQMLESLKEEIILLLESEVVFSYGGMDEWNVEESDLREVIGHIEKLTAKQAGSPTRIPAAIAGAVVSHLPLSFVLKEDDSLVELKAQLKALSLVGSYQLTPCDQAETLYYVAGESRKSKKSTGPDVTRQYDKFTSMTDRKRSHSFAGFSNICYWQQTGRCVSMETIDTGHAGADRDIIQSGRRWSDALRMAVDSGDTLVSITRKGYEMESSEVAAIEDIESGVSEAWRERPFRDFWLIINLTSVSLSTYLLERSPGSHRELWANLISELKNIIKRVNQMMLLQNLYDSRVCDNLLAPEHEDRLWRRQTVASSEGSESDYEVPQSAGYLAASSKFPLGYFSCPCVSYRWFAVHPRLKASVGRGGISRVSPATQAMQSLLNRFGVTNRENMYVYKEATGAVFYLRLHENSQSASAALNSIDETKLQALREKEVQGEASVTRRPETLGAAAAPVSKKFSLSKWAAKQYESQILLTMHGVRPSDGEIACQLVPALQHRLDDAVLDTLLVTLERNPSAKITQDDVEFLQPLGIDARSLQHYVLATVVLNHLYSFSYYLQQHLLEFCFKPNYASPDVLFRPYTEIKSLTNLDTGIFLYHPRVPGASGIAVLCFAYVDSAGHGVPVLSVDPVEPYDGITSFFRAGYSFESLTRISEYEPSKTKAAPPVLLQFAVWERGEVGLAQLSSRLVKSIKRAICDLVTEYGLLTAPLLENTLGDGTISEPGSPTVGKGPYETTVQAPLRKRHSSAAMHLLGQKSNVASTTAAPCSALPVGAPAPALFSFENIQALVRKATDVQPTQQEMDPAFRRRHNSQQMSGAFRGVQATNSADSASYLNPIYAELAPRWFDFVHEECGTSSVYRWSFALEADCSRTLILREVVEAMRKLLEPDVSIHCFAEFIRPMGIVVYESYKPSRSPVVVADDVESTSLDEKAGPHASSSRASSSFIIVGFSQGLWRDTMRFGRSGAYDSVPESIATIGRPSRRVLPRFPPLIPSATVAFVPRQRYFHIVLQDRQVTAYVYNWLTEVNSPLERLLMRLVFWHNARNRLLDQICLQKLGLFQVPLCNEMEAKENPYYFFAWPEADSYVACNTPPSQLMKGKSQHNYGSPYCPERCEWWQYLNANPSNDNRCGFDPVAAQGTRFIQFRNSFLRQKDDAAILRSVFHHLSRLKPDMEACLDEELLRIVISRSRLVHSVYTPLLFSPAWREKLASVRRPLMPTGSTSSPVASRSRHDSGPTTIGSRSSSTAGQMTTGGQGVGSSAGASMSPVLPHKPNATLFTTGVESWHAEVQKIMLQHYLRYLCEQLKLRKLSRRFRGQSDAKTAGNCQACPDIEAWAYCMSQCVITFVRCSYSEPYFAVHFYVFDASSLVPDLDTDEDEMADDVADLWTNLVTQSHLHSFSYDFHMRLVASYASGERRNVFKPGYNMNAFLVDFLQYYTCRPPFARTYVFEDRLVAHGMPVSTDQLYNYVLDHDKLFGLRVVRMRVSSTANADEPASEYILTSHGEFIARTPSRTDHGADGKPFQVLHLVMRDYENVDAWKEWLSLKFYVIFVDQTTVFPQCSGPLENAEHGKYHRVRTPSWAVSGDASANDGTARSTGRQPLRSVESVPCRVGGDRRSSSSFRINRRSLSGESRDGALDKAVSFTATAVATAAEATSSASGSGSFSPATVLDCGYFPIGLAAMAHNRTAFSSTDEQIACVDVVDLSEECPSGPPQSRTHSRARSSAGEYGTSGDSGATMKRRLPSLRPVEGSSLHTEQVTYLTYLTDEEFNMQKCLASEAGKFKDKLTRVVREASSQCKRDVLWKKLLYGVASESGAAKKKEDHAGIQLKEFELVLKTVHFVPLYSVDSTLDPLLNIPASWFPTLLRSLQQKYGGHCRHFVSALDPGRQYLAVLNSNYLDSFILVAVEQNATCLDISLVYKDYSAITAEPSCSVAGSAAAESRLYRSKTVQDFCESFVQALVYHQWTRLLPQ